MYKIYNYIEITKDIRIIENNLSGEMDKQLEPIALKKINIYKTWKKINASHKKNCSLV